MMMREINRIFSLTPLPLYEKVIAMNRSCFLLFGVLFLPGFLHAAEDAPFREQSITHYQHYRDADTLMNFIGAHPEATRGDAYDFQSAFSAAFVADGDEQLGYKLGFTGGQAPPGTDAPLVGSLFESQRVAAPYEIPLTEFRNPILEVELAFKFSRDVPKDAGIEEIRASVEAVAGAIEIPDVAYNQADAIHGLNFIAHNVLAKRLILFDWVPLEAAGDLNALVATLTKPDGSKIEYPATAVLPEKSDHLWAALAFAVKELAQERDLQIEAGDVVITGCMGRALRWPKTGETPGEYSIVPGQYEVDFGEALGEYQFTLLEGLEFDR